MPEIPVGRVVRAVRPSPSAQLQQALQLLAVEAHHRFAIDQRDRRCAEALLQKLLERGGIRADVLHREDDAFARKKLFLLVARPSSGLAVHDDLLGHCIPPLSLAITTAW